jgi:hypothetical protein
MIAWESCQGWALLWLVEFDHPTLVFAVDEFITCLSSSTLFLDLVRFLPSLVPTLVFARGNNSLSTRGFEQNRIPQTREGVKPGKLNTAIIIPNSGLDPCYG